VTTAKDAVRLEGASFSGVPVVVLGIAADILDEGRLRARLLSTAGNVA
jgi:hypothetical protein